MRGLKTLVIVMGVMLVVGFGALVAVIASRMAHRPAADVPTAQPFAGSPIDLPSGSHVETISVGGERLVLNVVLADGTRQLVIVELATGRQLGIIPLRTTH